MRVSGIEGEGERARRGSFPASSDLTGAGLRFYSRCRASKSESGTQTGETTQRQREET